MFGGHDWWQVFNGVGTYGDLWSWDGTNWTRLSPVSLPPPRHGHCMVFDKNRGTVILFGGVQEFASGSSLLHNDMWEWDGSDWTQVPDTGPAYGWMSAAYDATRQEILIQGGATSPDKSTADDKTWAYTAKTLFPVFDIKCNGGDANVIGALFLGPPKVTIDIDARDGTGYPVDLFRVIKAPQGAYYTYNGITRKPGLFSAYYTGPLMDLSDTILNMNVPLGSYEAYLAMDIRADGVLQLASVFDHDMVDFTVTP